MNRPKPLPKDIFFRSAWTPSTRGNCACPRNFNSSSAAIHWSSSHCSATWKCRTRRTGRVISTAPICNRRGKRSPNLLGLVALGMFFGLMLTWTILATLYFLPVWLVAFYTDRDLNFRASWKLAGAALMPGALLLTLGIVMYGFGVFDLVQLSFAFTMHFIISWIYLLISPLFLNRALPGDTGNPFGEKPNTDAAKN
jgi:hypothetical protein